MSGINIVTTGAEINHYGSTVVGPVASTIQDNTPSFVKIEGVSVSSAEDKIDTPSHVYDYDIDMNPLFHAHTDQVVDDTAQNYVKIDGNIVLLENDTSTTEDTRIDAAGQAFVTITI